MLPTCASALSTPVSLAVGAYVSIAPASDTGCVTLADNASADSVQYLIVGQSAGGVPGDSSTFILSGATLSTTAAPPRASPVTVASATKRGRGPIPRAFDRFLRGIGPGGRRLPAPARAAEAGPPARTGPPAVGSLRSYTVCSNLDCSTFASVTARAQAVGAHVAIYVDTLAPAGGLDSAAIDSLQQIFDQHVFAVDTTAFGLPSDVDSNGVVIVLMSNVINSLVSAAECETGGFVAGFFFPPDLDPATAAQYNDGEIFYTVVADPAGQLSCSHSTSDVSTFLPSTFVHEFQHMISFNQHVLLRGGNLEDLWLDEGLSSFAEELGARSFLPDTQAFSNNAFGDVYNAYLYLGFPQSHFLLQTSDTVLADFGAGWLYVRYLVDQFGTPLTRKLEQTTLTGTDNIAAQTGLPFATTVTRWALANWVSDLPGFTPAPELQYTSWSFRGVFGTLNAEDPFDFPVSFPLQPTVGSGSSVRVSGELDAGSGAYVIAVVTPHTRGYTLVFRATPTALISANLAPLVTVIRIR